MPIPPMPGYPGPVERSLSTDSSNDFVDYATSAHLQQQHYAPQSFTPPPTGVPNQRASGSGIATWARSGLPPSWMADGAMPPPMPMGYPSPAYAPPVAMHPYAPGMDFDDDELIPTARAWAWTVLRLTWQSCSRTSPSRYGPR